MKVRQIYWLLSSKTLIHERIIESLQVRKVTVTQVYNFQELSERFNQKRSSLIIIGDELGEDVLLDQLPKICSKPEFSGVRFILSFSRPSPKLSHLAVVLGFRDIISIDLPVSNWIKRFEFSAASSEMHWQEAIPQMTSHSISAVSIPARITWLDSNELRLESKIIMPKGSTARLTGKISEDLGLASISIRVLEHSRTNLRYRYSEAYQCQWKIPNSASNKHRLLIDSLKTPMEQAPYKVFIAVQTFNLRQILLQTLSDRSFDLTIALQKSGIFHETKYIDPDVVIIEHRLIDSKAEIYLTKMAENLRPEVPLYIVGASKSEQGRYERITGRKEPSLIVIPTLPPNFLPYLKRKLERLLTTENLESGYYIPRNHRFSFNELRLPARMIQIHPEAAHLIVPYSLGRFGFCMVDAPIFKQNLQRRIVGKIINSYQHQNPQHDSFPYTIELLIADLMKDEKQRIAQYLASHFSEQLLGEKLDPALLQISSKLNPSDLDGPSVNRSARNQGHPGAKRIVSYSRMPEIAIRDEAESSTRNRPKSFFERHGKELQAAAFAIFFFLIMFVLIFYLRQPETEQGKVFSDSFRRVREYYSPDEQNR